MEPTRRVIADHNGHTLILTWEGTCCDVQGEEVTYLFRFVSEADAIARWHGWLRSIGEER